MKKQRLVLASILKPVDDTRMFEKMGVSLAKANYDVTIIGYPSRQLSQASDGIRTIALSSYKRISLARLLAPLQVLRKVWRIKPDFLIVNTHELLGVAVISRIFLRSKIIYDIRENYWRNLLYTTAFPPILRQLLAGWVRLREKILSPFFHRFLLAEKGYQQEMAFFGNNYDLIENKCIRPEGFVRNPAPDKMHLLFTGTIAESTGIFLAIHLAKKLHDQDPAIRLTIIGYCAMESTRQALNREIEGHDYIKLIGGDALVPHQQIMQEISKASIGLVAYPPSRHLDNSIPTKLYEYLACGLPILLTPHPQWEALCRPVQAAWPVDFNEPDVPQILNALRNADFYTAEADQVTWPSEAARLLKVLQSI